MCVCVPWQLRVLSYGEGDFFLPHWDERAAIGASSELPEAASFLTMLLYLSSAESARSGATRISCPPANVGSAIFDQYEGTPAMGRAGCTVVEVTPRVGRVLVFPHRYVHEGAPVVGANAAKFVMRGDLLFHPPPARGAPEDEEEDDSDVSSDDGGGRGRRRRW
jgi:hypothetical protein